MVTAVFLPCSKIPRSTKISGVRLKITKQTVAPPLYHSDTNSRLSHFEDHMSLKITIMCSGIFSIAWLKEWCIWYKLQMYMNPATWLLHHLHISKDIRAVTISNTSQRLYLGACPAVASSRAKVSVFKGFTCGLKSGKILYFHGKGNREPWKGLLVLGFWSCVLCVLLYCFLIIILVLAVLLGSESILKLQTNDTR